MKLPKYSLFLLAIFGIAGLLGGSIFIPGPLQAAVVDFGLGDPEASWFQVEGGDVGAAGNVNSPVAAGESFMLNPQGVVSFRGSAVFSPGSSPNWLVNDDQNKIDLSQYTYNYFYSLLGSPTTPLFTGDFGQLSGDGVYYASGTIDKNAFSGNSQNFGKKVIVFVNGTLEIDQPVTLAANGFLAFIVLGNIVVDPIVGVAPNQKAVSLEGLYFANSILATGDSSNSGSERLNGRGIFVAQRGFTLQRNLGKDDNDKYPAETFIFDPGLLVKMPAALKKATMSWTEVTP